MRIFCSTDFAVPHVAEAEEASPDAVRLEEIVVTATKTEKRAEEAPASVTVVTQAEMLPLFHWWVCLLSAS